MPGPHGDPNTMNMAHMPCGLCLAWGGLWSAGNRLLAASHGNLHGPASLHPILGVRWAGAPGTLTFSRSGLTQCSVSWIYWFSSG